MKLLYLLLTISSLLLGNKRTQVHMGTLINITIVDENLSDEVFSIFADLDNRLSTYKSDSEISHLNRNLEHNVSEVTHQILERSMEMYHLSEGAFDITVGSFTHSTYRFGYDNEHLPSPMELTNAEKSVGSSRIEIEGNFVKILPGTVIDLGGIGKGYAVDLVMDRLMSKGVDKAVVAASGDIGCLGECTINIQDPVHPQGHIATIISTLPRFAISTSGNYERYIKNKSHNHLIDPKTGQSQQRYTSITLIDTQDNTRLDALATAVAIMQERKAITMLKKLKIAYVLIHNDGHIIKSLMPHGVRLNSSF